MIGPQFNDPEILAGLKLHPAIARGLQPEEYPEEYTAPYSHHGIPFRFVHPKELQRFTEFDRLQRTPKFGNPESHIKDLMESISNEGIRNPLSLNYSLKSNRAWLTEGHHRLIAASRLGMSHIPVIGHVTEDGTSRGGTIIQPIKSVQKNEFNWFPKTVDPLQIIKG